MIHIRKTVRGVYIGTLPVIAALGLASASANAQVFLNLDGFGTGTGSCTVQSPNGPATDSANISNLFFPQSGTQTASVGVASRGGAFAQITTDSVFDSGIIRLQSIILAQGSSICHENGCGNGSGSAGVTTRATFRVSEEAVLFLSGVISAASHVDPGIGGSGISSSTSSVVVTQGPTTLFGRTVRNSTGSLSTETIAEGGVARLIPGLDYEFTVASSGNGQAFGLNSSADGSASTIVMVRLFPPECPTVTAPSDLVHCASQPPAMFTVIASGALPRTVQWQRFSAGSWSDLADGAIVGVGTVSGATSTTLSISGPGIAANIFRSMVQNDCGIAFSDAATLTILPDSDRACGGPGCDPDANQDGNADQGDVDYLVNVVAGGPNSTGIDPDFNTDGNVDQGDIDALLNVVAGGPCP
ncbi:MAG: hypothetical protein WC718_04690 [Phycisphaerales bacterium]